MATETLVEPQTLPAEPVSATAWSPPPQGQWTYDDCAQLPDNSFRYEVIRGNLYMSPMPLTIHQLVLGHVSMELATHIMTKDLGEMLIGPIDVMLTQHTNVVPDVVFIATDRLHIIEAHYIRGAPDLIVEVLAPDNQWLERRTKFEVYARAGVREYWMVDPHARSIDIYVLRGEALAWLGTFGPQDTTRSEVLPELRVKVGEVCQTKK